MPSQTVDESDGVMPFEEFMGDSAVMQGLFDLARKLGLALADEDGIALEGLAFGKFLDSKPHTFGVLVGADPTYVEKRIRLRKTPVREPRDWVGTIRYNPDHDRVKFSGEAYGPKGDEDEDGLLMWLDDSLVRIANLLEAASLLPKGPSGFMHHRKEITPRSEQLIEEISA